MTTSGPTLGGRQPPLWRRIHDTLLDEIRSGEMAAAGRLPSAGKLAERFGVNRHTVRQALKALDEAGVTETKQGAGSFIVGYVVDYPITSKTRFSEIVLRQGMAPSGLLIEAKVRKPPKVVANALELAPGSKVIMIERVSMADDTKIGLSRHYYPADRFPGMEKTAEQFTSLTAVLREHGVEAYFRKTTSVSARLPTAREARLLGQRPSEPLIHTTSINVDEQGATIEYGDTLFSAERVRLRFDEAL